jgi:hypothetical protein
VASWATFEVEEPEMAAAVAARFGAARHHVLATIRADGSPRVSGTEVEIGGGELRLGSMWGARKAMDLRRDPRLALHAHTGDGSMTGGDAKLSGRAIEVAAEDRVADGEGPPRAHWFRVDLTEVVLTRVHPDGDRLVIERWRPGEGARSWERT